MSLAELSRPFSSTRDSNWVSINGEHYNICYSIHFVNSMASSCRRFLFNAVMKQSLMFKWKDVFITPSVEFQNILNTFWTSFCMDFIDYACFLGIVPLGFRNVGGHTVPYVFKGILGIDFDIRIRNVSGYLEYAFVRLKSKRGGTLSEEKIDKNITIWSGFGSDPSPNGDLSSIVSTIIRTISFQGKMNQYTLMAQHKLADPEIITERQETAMEKDFLPGAKTGMYEDWDQAKHAQQAKYVLNKAEIIQMREHQREMERLDQEDIDMDDSGGMPVMDVTKKQTKGNIYPLPPGHKVAKQNMPNGRNDWVEMNQHIEDLICSAYLVPRSLIIADRAHSDTSVRLTERTMLETVNKWRELLSDVCTQCYHHCYNDEDIRNVLKSYTKKELDEMSKKMNEDELFAFVSEPRVRVIFPMIPQETWDGLLTKYAIGMLNYSDFDFYSKLIAGYQPSMIYEESHASSRDRLKKKDDPWSQEMKLSMLRTQQDQVLAKLGIAGSVVIPQLQVEPIEKEGEDKKKNKSDKKTKSKKRPQRSSNSSEPKKKKSKTSKKSTSDDESSDSGSESDNNDNDSKSKTKKKKSTKSEKKEK